MMGNDPTAEDRPADSDLSKPSPPPVSESLAPGAGSPLVPGPPMSVQEPIRDTTLNRGGLMMFAGIAVVLIIVIAILITVLHH